MKFISLFAGIGGIDLGLERAGMECVAQVEIDEFCQKVLTKHWPDVPKYRDVREVGKHNLPNADLIAGGFPCQPVSIAGKREGEKDERWLWDDFFRVICEIRPEWILVENVPGLFSARNGKLFGGILRDLAACGYDAEWDVISAASVGAPHIRERVFILAYTQSEQDNGRKRERIFANSARSGAQTANVAYATSTTQTRENISQFRESLRPQSGVGKRTPRKNWWSCEPALERVVDGVPIELDRHKSLGNAVVPQVAEFIGRMIMEAA